MPVELTRSGWITVEHPTTGEQLSRHVQEREAVESAVNLAMRLGLPVIIRYEQTVRVEVAVPTPIPAPEPEPEPEPPLDTIGPWLTWGDAYLTFGNLTRITFGELT